jgi:nucleoside-diphosphate-sugar epimerase
MHIQPTSPPADATVLITGATGFIGRHCLTPLTRRFANVHAVSSRRIMPTHGIHWHQADLLDANQTARLISEVRPTHLLHLAWTTEHGRFWTSPDNLRWIEASLHLTRLFVEHGGRRLITAGTCAEYDWNHGHCHEEITPLTPATLYGRSKHALRLVIDSFAAINQISYASSRIFFMYGPCEVAQRLVPSLVLGLQAGRRIPCSHGQQRRDFLHVADVAAAHVELLTSDLQGPINIASGQAVTLRDIAHTIASLTGHAELIDWGGLPTRRDDPDLLVADVTRLKDELHFTPHYNLRTGLADAVAWWHSQKSNQAA